MKNTEVSRLLGDLWRNAPEDEKRPFVDKEKEEREKYKIAMAAWKKEFEAKQEAERSAQVQQHAAAGAVPVTPHHHAPYGYPNPYGDAQYGHVGMPYPHQYNPQYPYGKFLATGCTQRVLSSISHCLILHLQAFLRGPTLFLLTGNNP